MNFNFGLLPPVAAGPKRLGRRARKEAQVERARVTLAETIAAQGDWRLPHAERTA
jgi:hypothetical protein